MDCRVFPHVPSETLLLLFFSTYLAFLPKVHIQTIGILVSEKTELQTALSHTHQAARQKAGGNLDALSPSALACRQASSGIPSLGSISVISGEVEDLVCRLKSSRQRIAELERTLSALSTQQKQADRVSPAPNPTLPLVGWAVSLKVPSVEWSVLLPRGQPAPFLTALSSCGCEKQPGVSWLLWDLRCAVSSEAGVQGSEPGASPALTGCVWARARVLGIWAALLQNSVFSMLFSVQKGEECMCV